MNERLEQFAKRAYSSRETIQASYDIAFGALRNNTPGDFVECGVAAGSNAAAMALAIMDYERFSDGDTTRTAGRRVHLFDSFTGIPKCGPEDAEFIAANHPAGLTAHSLESVKSGMRNWGIPDELLVWHPGMFEATIGGAVDELGCVSFPRERLNRPKQIAVLRLDGDLYESTKVCIENLFPLVSKGGWVIVDDWDLSGARKAVIEHVGHGFGPIYFTRSYV